MKNLRNNFLLLVLLVGSISLSVAQTWTDVTATAPYAALQLNGANGTLPIVMAMELPTDKK